MRGGESFSAAIATGADPMTFAMQDRLEAFTSRGRASSLSALNEGGVDNDAEAAVPLRTSAPYAAPSDLCEEILEAQRKRGYVESRGGTRFTNQWAR